MSVSRFSDDLKSEASSESFMDINETEFFKEFTLRICGSLEIEKALWQCFLYARNFMPLDELALVVYDSDMGTLEIVATADPSGGRVRSVKTIIPKKIIKEAGQISRIRVADNIFEDPVAGRVARQLGWSESSIMVARLIIDRQFIGALYARTAGKGRYTKEHSRLWAIVNEPAAVAVENSQRFRELEEIRDLLADDRQYLQDELLQLSGAEIIGADFGLKDVMQRVRQVAPLPAPVLLLGETGTGKELIASAIHNISPRSTGPLIKVNCGGIPESLIDSELFGHEKGAFTGAVTQRRGRFERAHTGTIFLDEVAELSPSAQVKLLRVIQEREIERLGGSSPIKLDIRIIFATHDEYTFRFNRRASRSRGMLFYRLIEQAVVTDPLRFRQIVRRKRKM